MISVSSEFKTAVKGDAKEMYAYISYDSTTITDSDDLKKVKIITDGDLGKTVLRQAEITYTGTHSLLDELIHIFIGVKKADETIEYIDYGEFIVKEVDEKTESEYSIAKAYDHMYDSLIEYYLGGVEYPLTLKAFLEEICTKLGWTLGTTSFHNDDLSVTADYFALANTTFRKVLEKIAEATGTIIRFDLDDELVLINISDSVDESLTLSEQRNLKLESEWGALNSLMLSRTPEGDNVIEGGFNYEPLETEDENDITLEDGTTILQTEIPYWRDDLYQFVIENNEFLDGDREGLIEDLSLEYFGIQYYPSEVKTIGLGYFEVGDRIEVQDLSETDYETIILSVEIEVGEGFREIFRAAKFDKSRTLYDMKAGVITDTIEKTEIGTSNLADECVTSAKINSISADKITTGTLGVSQTIIVSENNIPQILIGYQEDGF